jgi:hypothetical protein
MAALLEDDQSPPACNCGFSGDARKRRVAQGHRKQPATPLASSLPTPRAERPGFHRSGRQLVRSNAEKNDPIALTVLNQQAIALARLFTITANFTNAAAHFLDVVETTPPMQQWYHAAACANTVLLRRATPPHHPHPRARPRHGRRPRRGDRRPPIAARPIRCEHHRSLHRASEDEVLACLINHSSWAVRPGRVRVGDEAGQDVRVAG